ncbi:DUF4838 domain-containing protein [Candidatus Sumerlaeota bacterium]|nr:DUF4838 domain-containing protein [Candidatus Sumerlaeota bacterium]
MRRKTWVVMGGILALALLPDCNVAAQSLVVRGKSEYRIVIGESCSPSERHAAKEFQYFINEISGASIPIQNDNEPISGPVICIGQSNLLADVDLKIGGLGAEGFVIKSKRAIRPARLHRRAGQADIGLIIVGGRERGALYGVYTFLEDYLGCRWFTLDCSRIPQSETIRLGKIDRRYVPPLEYRGTDYPLTRDPDWAARNKMNGNHHVTGPERGGNIRYGPFVHTFNSLIPPEQYFDKHPEYFSLVKGKRLKERSQLCLTNPDVLRLAKQRLREWIKQRPDATIFSVSQNDWHNYCECPNCTALAEREGSQSGPLLAFVNALAEDIENDYPHIIIDTLAYQYTRKPPNTIRPRPNVCVRLCSIECCFVHPLASDDYNATFRDDIVGWSKICNRLYIWDYVINYAHSIMPFPNLYVLKPNINFFVRNGAKGIYEEACYFTRGSELAELRSYIIAKTLWDPRYDTDRAIREFTDGYYEDAAPYIRRYLRLVHDSVEATTEHIHIYSPPKSKCLSPDVLEARARMPRVVRFAGVPVFYVPAFLRRAEPIFDVAEKAVADKQEVLDRVQVARLPIVYARIALALSPRDKADKLEREKVQALIDQFETIARRAKVTRVREGGPLASLDAWLKHARDAAAKLP